MTTNPTATTGIRRAPGDGDALHYCMRGDHAPWREILRAREAAHAKHGEHSIEALPADDPRWLPVLVEEVGEVARALTYDHHSRARLRAELVDVLAVASAWLAAVDAAPAPAPDPTLPTPETTCTTATRGARC